MLHRPHTSQPVPGRAFPGPARPLSYAAPFQRAQAAPPLGGVSSLREALAMVSTNKSVEKSDIEENNMPSKQSHLASLKETLGVVVQKGVDDSVQSSKKPAELPEAELRSMLAVDDGISDTPRTDT